MGLFLTGNIAFFVLAGAAWMFFQYGNSKVADTQRDYRHKVERFADERGKTTATVVLPNSLGSLTEVSQGDAEHEPIKRSKFSEAFNRLDRAFAAHPGQRREALIRAANESGGAGPKPCGMAWSGSDPVLSLQTAQQSGSSLSAALNQCATAIEALP